MGYVRHDFDDASSQAVRHAAGLHFSSRSYLVFTPLDLFRPLPSVSADDIASFPLGRAVSLEDIIDEVNRWLDRSAILERHESISLYSIPEGEGGYASVIGEFFREDHADRPSLMNAVRKTLQDVEGLPQRPAPVRSAEQYALIAA